MNTPETNDLDAGIDITIRRDPDDALFVATVRQLPGCVSQGRTVPDAVRNIAEAIELHCSASDQGDGLTDEQRARVRRSIARHRETLEKLS